MKTSYPIVLIVHPGTLGDVLLAVEAIRKVRKALSSHHVVWVGQSAVGKFLLECEEVHEIIGIEGPFLSTLFSGPSHVDDRLKDILQRCTHCVCWMVDHDKVITKRLQSLGIRVIIQSPQCAELMNVHLEERFMRTLRPWEIMADSYREKRALFNKFFRPSEFDHWRSKFSFIDTPYIVIHPGSGSRHKCVSPALVAAVARDLLERSGITLVILNGPADQCHVDSLLREIPSGMIHLVSHQSLSTVAVLLKKAALYIGHDSGISHLAAGVGTPSIVLFGPTNPVYWAPRGDHVTVIQGPPCQCEDWEQVKQCHQKPCLEISVDLILQKAHERISLNGESQISDFQSQICSNTSNSKFHLLDPCNSYSNPFLKFETCNMR